MNNVKCHIIFGALLYLCQCEADSSNKYNRVNLDAEVLMHDNLKDGRVVTSILSLGQKNISIDECGKNEFDAMWCFSCKSLNVFIRCMYNVEKWRKRE